MSADPRPLVVEICRLLATRNLTSAFGGNVSARMPDDSFWITPSRMHKARLQMEDLVRIDAGGDVAEGSGKPSSESFMHLMAYQALPMAGALIHAHPPAATGFAMTGQPMSTTALPEAYALLGPEVPLIGYVPPGSAEIAELVGRAMHPSRKAYLMAHHGVLTWGADLWEACDILETLEMYTQSLIAATLLGGPVPLPENELRILAARYHEIE